MRSGELDASEGIDVGSWLGWPWRTAWRTGRRLTQKRMTPRGSFCWALVQDGMRRVSPVSTRKKRVGVRAVDTGGEGGERQECGREVEDDSGLEDGVKGAARIYRDEPGTPLVMECGPEGNSFNAAAETPNCPTSLKIVSKRDQYS